jgi:hypothetical protein
MRASGESILGVGVGVEAMRRNGRGDARRPNKHQTNIKQTSNKHQTNNVGTADLII